MGWWRRRCHGQEVGALTPAESPARDGKGRVGPTSADAGRVPHAGGGLEELDERHERAQPALVRLEDAAGGQELGGAAEVGLEALAALADEARVAVADDARVALGGQLRQRAGALVVAEPPLALDWLPCYGYTGSTPPRRHGAARGAAS